MTTSEALEFAKIKHEKLRESVSICKIFVFIVKYRVLLFIPSDIIAFYVRRNMAVVANL